MKTYEATERAYKNGYEKGYEDGKRDALKVTQSQWVTRLHSTDGKIDSFSHLCPECKYEYRDQSVKGHIFCPNCFVEMDGDVHE